ncbi:hypothetical protein ACFEVT_003786, partial [Escherichia coli]
RQISRKNETGRVPRASGDKPNFTSSAVGVILCSPRQRGLTVCKFIQGYRQLVFPAPAGINRLQ